MNGSARHLLRTTIATLPALAMLAACGEGGRNLGLDGRGESPGMQLKVLSNRADLISGGDALVEVSMPAGAPVSRMAVRLAGRDITEAFAVRENGRYMGLVTGLDLGPNDLEAQFPDGKGQRITLINHPIGGPIFSGPQVQPWVCTTESNGLGPPQDDKCNAPTTYNYLFVPAGGAEHCTDPACVNGFMPYDPDNPPPTSAIEIITSDHGVTVPFIVRQERGTMNRGIYDIAVLYDPTQDWEPWAPQEVWNRKMYFAHGAGCSPVYSQGTAQNPLDASALARGYLVAVSTRNQFGNGCNLNVSAETQMMITEHVTETYGPIRYTIGQGGSGGAEAQHSITENYPGLLDGIRPTATYADGWTPAFWDKGDCPLLIRYFDENPGLWPLETERAAVTGANATTSLCQAQDGLAVWDPTTGCGLPAEQQYHPENNPTGARCTMQDYNVAAIGHRPDGFAYKLFDYVGLQWGLLALLEGRISAEQFVHLNENIGSFDIDFQWQPERTEADVEGLRNFYRSGQFTYGRNLARVPSIDARGNWTADFHSNRQRDVVRERLLRSWGSAESQIYWDEANPVAPFGLASPFLTEMSLDVMDDWLRAIEQDTGREPLEAKVVEHKPAEAVDGCFAAGQRVDAAVCDAFWEDNLLPRMVAGQPLTGDVLKCQLKPPSRDDYPGVSFTDEQWERLAATFLSGVCDWSQPGVGQQPPVGDWLSFTDGPGGRPLGPAPTSAPF